MGVHQGFPPPQEQLRQQSRLRWGDIGEREGPELHPREPDDDSVVVVAVTIIVIVIVVVVAPEVPEAAESGIEVVAPEVPQAAHFGVEVVAVTIVELGVLDVPLAGVAVSRGDPGLVTDTRVAFRSRCHHGRLMR